MSRLKLPKTETVEKLFIVSQNRPIIELSKFFGWTTTPLCGNLDLIITHEMERAWPQCNFI